MDQLAQDARIALRQLSKQRGFAAVVVVTLGLAMGVSTLVFSFVNFFVLRPLPFGDVSRTVMVFARHPERGRDRMPVSYPDLVEWRRDSQSFEDLGGFARRTFNLTGVGEPRRVQGALASAGLFSVWNLGPVQGRVIEAADDRPGAQRIAVLSHGFWAREFGSDPGVVGRTLSLDGIPHVLVGVVTPAVEFGNLSEIDVWTALGPVADPADREARTVHVTARLKPGVEVAQAQAEMMALARRQEAEHPATNARWTAEVQPIRRAVTGASSWVVLTLMAVAVALVLAIACANVANLVLARGIARRREIAVRAALGASRRRLLGQFLVEGAVLAVLGGAVGLVLASAGLDLIRAVTFEAFFQMVTLDRRVLAFSAVTSLLTPVLFSLLPGLQAAGRDVVGGLKDAGGGAIGASRGRARGRNLLVVAQLSVALSLLLVAGLALRMAQELHRLDLGFDADDLLTFKAELPASRYGADEAVRAFAARLQERLAATPGASGVAVATGRPVVDVVPTETLAIEGAEPRSQEAQPWAAKSVVSAGYFETLRIPIRKGRAPAAADAPGSEPVVVVNQALADRYFRGTDPLGRRLRLGRAESPWRTVVGIAGDVMNAHPGEPAMPQAYIPLAQEPSRALTVFVRTSRLDAVTAAARREVAEMDPLQPLYDVKTMRRVFYEETASNRVITGLFVVFAAVALGIAGVGLYGLVSYSVSQRTREIGLRVALGARRSDILRMVLVQGLRLTGSGLAIGIVLGLALARVMASALSGVSPTDRLTFTLVPAVLAAVALLATAIPARRAARCDPAAVLKSE